MPRYRAYEDKLVLFENMRCPQQLLQPGVLLSQLRSLDLHWHPRIAIDPRPSDKNASERLLLDPIRMVSQAASCRKSLRPCMREIT